MSRTILITELAMDPRLQMRVKIDKKTVEEYAQAPAKLPPVEAVMDEDGKVWPWDGHHTIEAYKFRGLKEVPVNIRSGTFHEAMALAAGANATHGLPLTTEDKKKKVKIVLAESQWANASSRSVADICNVSNHFVEKIRGEASGNAPDNSDRTASDGGKAPRSPKKPKSEKTEPTSPTTRNTTAEWGFQMCARCAGINAPSCPACKKKHLAVAEKNRKVEERFDFSVVYGLLKGLRGQMRLFKKEHSDKDSLHPETVENAIHEVRVAFRTWYREATNKKPPEE